MDTAPAAETIECGVTFDHSQDDTLLVLIAGNCVIESEMPSDSEIENEVRTATGIRQIAFDSKGLSGWDSGLLVFLKNVFDQCSQSGLQLDTEGLPPGVRRLMTLSSAVPERKGARKEIVRVPFLEQVGQSALDLQNSILEMLGFKGRWI